MNTQSLCPSDSFESLSTVDLHRCNSQALEAWCRSAGFYVPLPLAAALVFHAGRECADGLLSKRDYEMGLNVAAAWLSRREAAYSQTAAPFMSPGPAVASPR